MIALEADYPAGVPCARVSTSAAAPAFPRRSCGHDDRPSSDAFAPSSPSTRRASRGTRTRRQRSLPPGVQFVQATAAATSRAAPTTPGFGHGRRHDTRSTPTRRSSLRAGCWCRTTRPAPARARQRAEDYWFSQEFRLLDQSGKVYVKQGTPGGWQVTFQPDAPSGDRSARASGARSSARRERIRRPSAIMAATRVERISSASGSCGSSDVVRRLPTGYPPRPRSPRLVSLDDDEMVRSITPTRSMPPARSVGADSLSIAHAEGALAVADEAPPCRVGAGGEAPRPPRDGRGTRRIRQLRCAGRRARCRPRAR